MRNISAATGVIFALLCHVLTWLAMGISTYFALGDVGGVAFALLCLHVVVLAILNEKLGIAAIAYMMGISWGTLAGCFLGPFVLGLLWRRVTAAAAWSSICTSLGLTVLLIILFGYDKLGYACTFGEALKAGLGCSPMIGVICMAASLLVTATVSLFTKAPSPEVIGRAFDSPLENEIK